MPRGRIGALASAARRVRDAKAVAAAGAAKKKTQRSSTAAALIELHREFFESLSPTQYEKLYAAFLAHGKSEQGFVTAKELGPLLKSLGDEPRSRELQDLISLVDADGNALVDFTEFLTLVAVRSQHAQPAEELLEAFRLFDTTGDGTVQVAVFRQAMMQLCGLSAEETESMVAEAREVTRQHEARQHELDDARAERRRQRKLHHHHHHHHHTAEAAVTAEGGASAAPASVDVAGAPPPEEDEVRPGEATASVAAAAAAGAKGSGGGDAGRPPPRSVLKPPTAAPESGAGGGAAAAVTAGPRATPERDVIYYEPLVRILFSF